ncbi:MAG TPA: transposase, partial [Acidobacteriaceae bacterium]|nr:transposase [Acidobacteriaceae bacterium]
QATYPPAPSISRTTARRDPSASLGSPTSTAPLPRSSAASCSRRTRRPGHQLRVCYEAGPTGYVLYWQLTALGVDCQVVAPALVPTKAGDRVKTDRRDAEKLARCHRAGDLTAVWVPDEAHEALRDLIRAREAAKTDQQRAR